jgi:hypothetical protein
MSILALSFYRVRAFESGWAMSEQQAFLDELLLALVDRPGAHASELTLVGGAGTEEGLEELGRRGLAAYDASSKTWRALVESSSSAGGDHVPGTLSGDPIEVLRARRAMSMHGVLVVSMARNIFSGQAIGSPIIRWVGREVPTQQQQMIEAFVIEITKDSTELEDSEDLSKRISENLEIWLKERFGPRPEVHVSIIDVS